MYAYNSIFNSPEFDWKDKEIRHIDEAYIAIALALILFMLIGARFLLAGW